MEGRRRSPDTAIQGAFGSPGEQDVRAAKPPHSSILFVRTAWM